MAHRPDLVELTGRQIGWVALSGLALGPVWAMIGVILIPRWELFSLTTLVDLTVFVLTGVVGSPTVLAVIGTWWATERVAAWHIRVSAAVQASKFERSDLQ